MCGAAGCNITRSATVSGRQCHHQLLAYQQQSCSQQYLEGDYSINGGTSWVPMQRITTGGVLSIPPGGCNPCTISAGAATLTVRFRETTRWAAAYAQVDNVNIAFNDSVGSSAQRTANLTGATSAPSPASLMLPRTPRDRYCGGRSRAAAAGPSLPWLPSPAALECFASHNLTSYISGDNHSDFVSRADQRCEDKTFSVDNVTLAYNVSWQALIRLIWWSLPFCLRSYSANNSQHHSTLLWTTPWRDRHHNQHRFDDVHSVPIATQRKRH